MDQLKDGLYTIAVTAISCGMINVFSRSVKLRKYTSYVISLIIILSLSKPIINIVSNLSAEGFDFVGTETDDAGSGYAPLKKNIETAIIQNLSDKLGFDSEACSADITLKETATEILIEKIAIQITERRYNRYSERIKMYLESTFGCEVTVSQMLEEQ